MPIYVVALITVAVAVVFIIATTLIPSIVIHKSVFGGRQEKVELFKYAEAADFGVEFAPLDVDYNGIKLYSGIYSVKPLEECEKVVIFAHGFGAGSASYITEIAHFAKQGFAVVATDAYGCNNSGGKDVKGFYANAEAVIATYIAVKKCPQLSNKGVVLAGHSWGAYSVLAASQKIKVEGVVAMSAFNAPAQCVCDLMKPMGGLVKAYSRLVHGWLWFINLCKFGAKGNTKACKAIKKSGAKALIIHGEKDAVVPLKHSAAKKTSCKAARVVLLQDKRHNPYNTVAAENKLAELVQRHDFESEEQKRQYFEDFDWKLVTEEDEEVMGMIDAFIKEA